MTDVIDCRLLWRVDERRRRVRSAAEDPPDVEEIVADHAEAYPTSYATIPLIPAAVPPGNGLEALKRGRRGQHSIRINDQYRICFRWEDGYVDDVEVTDFH